MPRACISLQYVRERDFKLGSMSEPKPDRDLSEVCAAEMGASPSTAAAAEDISTEPEPTETSLPTSGTDVREQEEAKRAAIRDMKSPPGWKRITVPNRAGHRSLLYEYGVRFEQDCDKPDPKKQLFFCMADEVCRAESLKARATGGIQIEKTATGNATRHIKKHGAISAKTKKTLANKAKHEDAVCDIKVSALFGADKSRFLALLYVKVFIISHFLSFSFAESDDVRLFFKMCCLPEFFSAPLYSTIIKHYIVEIYAATVLRFSHQLHSAIPGAGGPIFHVNFDLWISKVSNEKYIGLRLYWLNGTFVLCTALLAVKLFRPAAELSDGHQLSNILFLWVKEVLAEYKLQPKHLFSSVTDAGSDAKRLCCKVMSSAWEWSMPHMLNCALVEAFGTNASRAACKNVGARAIIDKIKKVIEHLNKSPSFKVKFEDIACLVYGNPSKLVNAMPHRWISTCNVLEAVLSNWFSLEKHYINNETVSFPLTQIKTEIEELYSLMKPVAVLIQNCQRTNVPRGLSSFLDLIALRTCTLNVVKPLRVQCPRKPLQGSFDQLPAPQATSREAAALQDVTKTTRSMLAIAIDKRFIDARYNEKNKNPGPDYLFEMAATMHPFLTKLPFLEAVCCSTKHAEHVRRVVKGKVLSLMTSMAEEAAKDGDVRQVGRGKRKAGARKGGASQKKLKMAPVVLEKSKRAADEETQHLLDSGMFGDMTDVVEQPVGPKTVEGQCKEELEVFQARGKDQTLRTMPLSTMLEYWGGEGGRLYPNLARAARVLLSVPASSAVLERDLSTAGRLITETRSRLDAAYAEMVLFLNGSKEVIPHEVPRLTTEQATEAMPRRLTCPCSEVDTLSAGVGGEIGIPGLDDSGVKPQDEFSLEQKETSEPLENEVD